MNQVVRVHNSETLYQALQKKTRFIELVPGEYELSVSIPKNTYLKGSGKNNTTISILESIYIHPGVKISEVRLEYFNFKLEENLKILKVGGRDVDLMDMGKETYHENLEVIFSDVDIWMVDFITGCFFYLQRGTLNLRRVNIKSHYSEEEYVLSKNNHSLFGGQYFVKLELDSCEIDFKTQVDQSFIFLHYLSTIQITNSQINFLPVVPVKNSHIFYQTYCRIYLKNSKVSNLLREGSIMYWNQDHTILNQSLISNLRIREGFLYIKSLFNYRLQDKIIPFLRGIKYLDNTYIFNRIEFIDEMIKIELSQLGEYEDLEYVVGPEVKFIFGTYIQNCDFQELVDDLTLLAYPRQSYHLNCSQVRMISSKQDRWFLISGQKNLELDAKHGILYSPQIKSDNYNLTLEKLFQKQNQNGYSLMKQEKLGYRSVDLSLNGNNKSIGKYNLTANLDNENQGDYSTLFGKSNRNFQNYNLTCGEKLENHSSHSLCIGKFNDFQSLTSKTLLVVGNGTQINRNNALVLYEDGILQVDKLIQSPRISEGQIIMEDGNITNISHLEVEEKVFINGDIELEGELGGTKVNPWSQVVNINSQLITTLKIDLRDYSFPAQPLGVIGRKDNWYGNILKLDEMVSGVIYRLEMICVETPNIGDFRLVSCNLDNLKKGNIPENILSEECLCQEIISSYTWKKGKRRVEEEMFQLEWDHEISVTHLYLCRNIYNKKYEWNQEMELEGKFLIRITGGEIF